MTNALKYAYAGKKSGALSIQLKEQAGGRAVLTVRDDGAGFDPDTIQQGMGSRLIKGMMMQLDGTYSYTVDGGAVFTADIAMRVGSDPASVSEADAASAAA